LLRQPEKMKKNNIDVRFTHLWKAADVELISNISAGKFVYLNKNKRMYIWDLVEDREVSSFVINQEMNFDICFHADRNIAAVASESNVYIYNCLTGELIGKHIGNGSELNIHDSFGVVRRRVSVSYDGIKQVQMLDSGDFVVSLFCTNEMNVWKIYWE